MLFWRIYPLIYDILAYTPFNLGKPLSYWLPRRLPTAAFAVVNTDSDGLLGD